MVGVEENQKTKNRKGKLNKKLWTKKHKDKYKKD